MGFCCLVPGGRDGNYSANPGPFDLRVEIGQLKCLLAGRQETINKRDLTIRSLEGELERLRKTSKRASELASENARLKAQLQECRLELQMMKEKEAAAQEALRANAGGAQTLEEAQKAFLEARARADSLQAQLDQALKAAASGDTDRLRAQAQAAQEQLDAERARTRQAEAMNAKLIRDIEALKAQLNDNAELLDAQETIRTLEERLTAAAATLAAAEAQSVQIEMLQEENYALVTMRNEEAQGHGNQKQKIQYTKRVKDELDQVKAKLAILLKEKFDLEQCVRFLSVSTYTAVPIQNRVPVSEDKRTAFQIPPSLAQNANYLDSIGKEKTSKDPQDPYEVTAEAGKQRVLKGKNDGLSSSGKNVLKGADGNDMNRVEARIKGKIHALCTPEIRANLAAFGVLPWIEGDQVNTLERPGSMLRSTSDASLQQIAQRTMQKSGTMSRDRSTTKIAFAEDVKAADESRQGTARVLSASPSALSRTGSFGGASRFK